MPASWNLSLEVCVLCPASPNEFFIWTAALCQIEMQRRSSSYKAQNTQPRLLCDSRGVPMQRNLTKEESKRCLYDVFSYYTLLKAQYVILVSHWSVFWCLLAAREYPVCEPSCKSNKNYWFWIGKKVSACALASCKWTMKQWKKVSRFCNDTFDQ